MHLDEERIQRFLHGELDARERSAVSSHLATCGACAQRVAEAEREEREVFDLLTALDHAAPRGDAGAVMQTGEKGMHRMNAHRNPWARRAALFVLIVALGGAAYAIPGSPVPAWLQKIGSALRGDGGQAPVDESSPADTDTITTEAPSVSGLAIPPTKSFAIVFAVPQETGNVFLTATDGFNVVIRAVGGTPKFTLTSADRLDVDNTGLSASYEIEVPRSAKYVELRVGGRHVILKDGLRIGEDLPLDDEGRHVIALTPLQ